MRTFVVSMVAAMLMSSIAGPVGAAPKKKKHRPSLDAYAQRHPSATPRQLRNLRAYERGDYYETLSDALPVGSKPWFEQKEREGPRPFGF